MIKLYMYSIHATALWLFANWSSIWFKNHADISAMWSCGAKISEVKILYMWGFYFYI